MRRAVAVSEAARRDLYTGLAENCSDPERTDTLMAYLSDDPATFATKADLDLLESRLSGHIDGLDTRIDGLDWTRRWAWWKRPSGPSTSGSTGSSSPFVTGVFAVILALIGVIIRGLG